MLAAATSCTIPPAPIRTHRVRRPVFYLFPWIPAIALTAAAAESARTAPPLAPPGPVRTALEWEAWEQERKAKHWRIIDAELATLRELCRALPIGCSAIEAMIEEKYAEQDARDGIAPEITARRSELGARLDLYYDLLTDRQSLRVVEPLSDSAVRVCVDALFEDWGSPAVNAWKEDHILNAVHLAIALAELEGKTLPQEARNIIRDGLVDYAATGGASYSPWAECHLINVLLQCAEPGDAAAEDIALALYADADRWLEELGYTGYGRTAAKHLDDAVRQRIELLLNEQQLVAQRAPANAQSQETLAILLGHESWTVEQARQLTLLSKRCSDRTRKLSDRDLLRLLTHCRKVIEHHQTQDQIRAQVEAGLLELAKAGCIQTIRQWQLWSDAIRALRNRASENTRQFLRSRITEESRPAVLRALRSAARAIGVERPSSAPATQPQPNRKP